MSHSHIYIAIDLKSFYASVECVERNLDPLTTNLVVADESRTEKTICLAVSPSLKQYGISGRSRLFEVIQKVKDINNQRRQQAPYHRLIKQSFCSTDLKQHPEYELSYIVAVPRMAFYIDYSTKIYNIYLKYFSAEDIHVYSIDEVFIDATHYLQVYQLTPKQLTMKIIKDILDTTGITATAGIGTNLYLCKVAMDIVAKHIQADSNGVRIAMLNEKMYRRLLWNHQPLTDFWRVGRGISKKLNDKGIYTMGDIARCSLGTDNDYYNEDLLYKMFGVNAELLIDHAWGYESCTMQDIKNYRPLSKSIGSAQVLHSPYEYEKAKIVVKEMVNQLSLDLIEKGFVCQQVVLTIGYDIENISDSLYLGEIKTDFYGRKIPKHAHGTIHLQRYTTSSMIMTKKVMELYQRIINPNLLIRRIYLTAIHITSKEIADNQIVSKQFNLFTDYKEQDQYFNDEEIKLKKESNLQHAILNIQKKYGKNSIMKVMDLQEGATTIDRNQQIGGHKA